MRCVTRDEILKALEVVIDPELRRSIVELEMVRSIEIQADGVVDVVVSLTTAGCPIRNHFQTAVADAAGSVAGVTRVNVSFDVLSDSLTLEKGWAELPTAPGLGVAVDEKQAAKHPFQQEPLMRYFHNDGSVADW